MAIATERFPRRQVEEYVKVRPRVCSGDLLLCSGTAPFSRMIQKATKSVWSHVGFVMRLGAIDRVMVLESVESRGVRTVPLRRYLTDYRGGTKKRPYPGGVVLARHAGLAERATSAQLRRLGQFAADLLGYPYDNDEIVRIAARITAGRLGLPAREGRALRRDREYICSEYVFECYKSLGVHVQHDKRGFVAPVDFAREKRVELVAVLQKRRR